ncbi:hypothetical protein [Novosphingobium aromaticivorans]|nr:hypothetical protein [Novosphingobium aromaticivorans]
MAAIVIPVSKELNEIVSLQIATWFNRVSFSSAEIDRGGAKFASLPAT